MHLTLAVRQRMNRIQMFSVFLSPAVSEKLFSPQHTADYPKDNDWNTVCILFALFLPSLYLILLLTSVQIKKSIRSFSFFLNRIQDIVSFFDQFMNVLLFLNIVVHGNTDGT